MANTNVSFKRGTQANLNALKGYTNGCFYLTTDTDRLYVAQSDTELVELNKSITIVTGASGLPSNTSTSTTEIKGSEVAVGQFYYLSATNILAVCSAINSTSGVITWTQINPDTNTDTVVTSATITKNTDSSDSTKLVYDLALGRTKTNTKTGATSTENSVTATLEISSSDLAQITTDAAVAVGASAPASNATTVNTSGNGSGGTGFTISGGTNVTIGGSENAITITAKDSTYSLGSAANSTNVTLTGGGSASGTNTVGFEAGTNLSVSGATAGKIKYSHSTSGVTAASYGAGQTGTADTASANGGTLSIPAITVDAQGHVTSASTTTYTLSDRDTTYTADSITAGNDGKITFGIKAGGTGSGSGTSTKTSTSAILYHKITVDGTENTVNNQNSLGSFYSAGQVDTLISTAKAEMDSMTYKGAIASSTALLALTSVQRGDTYKASSDFTLGSTAVKTGDLVIFNEADNTANAASCWDVVPSGNEDTTYSFALANNTLSVTPSTASGASTTLLQIDGGNKLTATTSGTKVTLNHDTSGVTAAEYGAGKTQTSKTSLSANGGTLSVPTVTVDAYGHVTAASTTTYTLSDRDSKYALSGSVSTTDAVATVTSTLTGSGSASGITTSTFTLTGGDALTVSSSNSAITVSHDASGATVGSYGESAAKTLTHGGTFSIPYVTVDAQGHVTAISGKTMTMPSDNNTTYALSASANTVSNNKFTHTNQLKPNSGSNTTTASFTIESDNLTLSQVQTNSVDSGVKINLEWGTF